MTGRAYCRRQVPFFILFYFIFLQIIVNATFLVTVSVADTVVVWMIEFADGLPI